LRLIALQRGLGIRRCQMKALTAVRAGHERPEGDWLAMDQWCPGKPGKPPYAAYGISQLLTLGVVLYECQLCIKCPSKVETLQLIFGDFSLLAPGL